MDAILELQKRKQEIEQQNSLANMLVSLRNAFEDHISLLNNGNKQAELQIPVSCQFAMNMAGYSNVYDFIDMLRYSLTDYISSILFNGYTTRASCMIVRSYKWNDIELSEWISEISDLLDDISAWRNNLSDRMFNAKYQ